jgi:hypothetical protein
MDNIKGAREAFLSPSGAKYLFCNTYQPHGGACPLSAITTSPINRNLNAQVAPTAAHASKKPILLQP